MAGPARARNRLRGRRTRIHLPRAEALGMVATLTKRALKGRNRSDGDRACVAPSGLFALGFRGPGALPRADEFQPFGLARLATPLFAWPWVRLRPPPAGRETSKKFLTPIVLLTFARRRTGNRAISGPVKQLHA